MQESYGVWGGLSAEEDSALLRTRRGSATAHTCPSLTRNHCLTLLRMSQVRSSAVSAVLLMAAVGLSAGCSASSVPAAVPSSTTAATSTSTGAAPTTPVPAGAVVVSGAVRQPVTLSLDGLRAYPPRTQAVSFGSAKGQESHTYQGAALTDVMPKADVVMAPAVKNPQLRLAVVASGSDDYEAVVSWGEFSPDFGAFPVLVAYTQDGQPLSAPRLVVPRDKKGGRYVSGLTGLKVVDLSTH